MLKFGGCPRPIPGRNGCLFFGASLLFRSRDQAVRDTPGLVPTSATVERRSQRPNPSRGGKRPHAFQRPDATPGTDRLLSRRSSARSITRAAESSVLSIRGHAACTDGETRCRDETRPSATSVSETVEASSPVPFIVRPWNGRARGVILRGHHVRSTCRRSVRPAIHVPSRGSPRSSSTSEPSDPPFRAIYGVTQLLSRFRFILATTAGSEGLRPGLHGPLSSVLRRYHLFSTSPTELSSEPI